MGAISSGVEHYIDIVGVTGSNPVSPILKLNIQNDTPVERVNVVISPRSVLP